MGEKLQQGEGLPRVTLQMLDGGTVTLPTTHPPATQRCCTTGDIGDPTAIGS